ncbi:MAG TPA: DegT/DnrJ/EryC1/StrS family aminotransferase [Polyangium sp.]|nr:DegT/DnrJ/EryC1/StrS family aminotransferase [Polyangium sp.]
MRIPLVDLQRQHQAIRNEVNEAIQSVIESQIFILEPEVAAFEAEVAARLRAARAVGVACGSDALLLALMAAGVRPGDEVITTPFSFIATPEAIARLGAIAVFADIEADSFNLDPDRALEKISPRTRAFVPVHLYGRCARMEPLIEAACARGLVVIEDAAQAFDAQRLGKNAGAWGDYGCFSFFPSKNLGGWGDGGMVVTRDPENGAHIARLRAHGGIKHYVSEEIGANSRLDALQAAVLRVKLRHVASWTIARRQVAANYRELFSSHALLDDIELPADDPHGLHVYNQFTIRCSQRDALAGYLTQQGIGSAVYYPLPLHLQPCFARLGHAPGDFPIAERACRDVLSLPMHPFIRADEQSYIVEKIRHFIRGGS